MFKGFEKVNDIQYIYTPFDSSLCGVKLEANSQKQYLLTGKLKTSSGPMSLCPRQGGARLTLGSKLNHFLGHKQLHNSRQPELGEALVTSLSVPLPS